MTAAGTVVVTGASSQLGVFLLPRLSKAGYSVQAVSRKAPEGSLEVAGRVCWRRPEDADEARYLVSCGPIRLAASMVERSGSLRKMVVFSTSSVLTKTESGDESERSTVSAIASEERRIETLCREHGIDLVLLRPTLIYGCGLDNNISLLLRLGERTGFIPVSGRASGLRKPVHADDLARLACEALSAETGACLRAESAGGSTLSYREMLERIRACGSRGIRLVTLPEYMLALLVRAACVFGPWKGLNEEMVYRQAVDMNFDDARLREALDWHPRPFEPTQQDFRVPPDLERYRLPL